MAYRGYAEEEEPLDGENYCPSDEEDEEDDEDGQETEEEDEDYDEYPSEHGQASPGDAAAASCHLNFGHGNNDNDDELQHATSSNEVTTRTFLTDAEELIEDLGFRRARRKLAVPDWKFADGTVVDDSSDHSGIAAIDQFGLLLVCCSWGTLSNIQAQAK